MVKPRNSIVIFGCGNVVMGDDGFGPAVVEEVLARFQLPEHIRAVDASTGVRDYLFDYLLVADDRPDLLIIVDAVEMVGRVAGEVFEIRVNQIPARKIADFSLHQFPTVNLLQELVEHTGVEVLILAAQVAQLSEEIAPGLSPQMTDAVGKASLWLGRYLGLSLNQNLLAHPTVCGRQEATGGGHGPVEYIMGRDSGRGGNPVSSNPPITVDEG